MTAFAWVAAVLCAWFALACVCAPFIGALLRRRATTAAMDQAIASVTGRRWVHATCGCGWTTGPYPVVVVCAGHWVRLYRASDYLAWDKELSQ